MNDWIRSVSSTVKVSVAETPWGGTNLIAKERVKKGEIVLEMKEEGVFSLNTVLTHPVLGPTMTDLAEKGVSSHLLLILTLM